MITSPIPGLRAARRRPGAPRLDAQDRPAAGLRALRVTAALLGLAAIGAYLAISRWRG